jgi:deoxyribonuclease (pyrimidine dimer)
MVRVNIIKPKKLLDQHLIAEWNEIQMLLGTIVKYPNIRTIVPDFKLGRGHINFFKDKALYLMRRLQSIREEMLSRGYEPSKTITEIGDFYIPKIPEVHLQNWHPTVRDFEIIKERLIEKHSQKPDWYTYYGRTKSIDEYSAILK